MSASMDESMAEVVKAADQVSQDAVREEDRRIRKLRMLVDFSLALIAQTDLSLVQAQNLVQAVREKAHELFPGKEETFELIYGRRFRRLISEKFGLH